jgi:hypothetical protein
LSERPFAPFGNFLMRLRPDLALSILILIVKFKSLDSLPIFERPGPAGGPHPPGRLFRQFADRTVASLQRPHIVCMERGSDEPPRLAEAYGGITLFLFQGGNLRGSGGLPLGAAPGWAAFSPDFQVALAGPGAQAHSSAAALREGDFAMHSDPRFWALVVAIWFGLVLAFINIAVKIHMLMDLTSQE